MVTQEQMKVWDKPILMINPSVQLPSISKKGNKSIFSLIWKDMTQLSLSLHKTSSSTCVLDPILSWKHTLPWFHTPFSNSYPLYMLLNPSVAKLHWNFPLLLNYLVSPTSTWKPLLFDIHIIKCKDDLSISFFFSLYLFWAFTDPIIWVRWQESKEITRYHQSSLSN